MATSSIVAKVCQGKTGLGCQKCSTELLERMCTGWRRGVTRGDESTSSGTSAAVRLPRRSRKYDVGKEIGGAVYVHRKYESVFGPPVDDARKRLPQDSEYTVVKLNLANSTFSFIQVSDFDTAPEPTVGAVIIVKQDGTTRSIRPPTDPFIYHHKWLFVADDYDGFDVEESKRRSLAWMSLPDVDKARIGRKSYWETDVVPRIRERTGENTAPEE